MADWMVIVEDHEGCIFEEPEFFDTEEEARAFKKPDPFYEGHTVVLYRVHFEDILHESPFLAEKAPKENIE